MRSLVLVAVLLLGGSTQEASAQWMFPLRPLTIVEPVETWNTVQFHGTLSYELDGCLHYVSPNGDHWRTGTAGSALVPNKFVEPFDVFGNRIVKAVPFLPVGTEYTIQSGWKTHAVVNGKSHFATWVYTADGRIRTVWVGIEVVQTPSPLTPTEVSPREYSPNPVQLGPGIEPIEEPSLAIPQEIEMPPAPIPAPRLPSPAPSVK